MRHSHRPVKSLAKSLALMCAAALLAGGCTGNDSSETDEGGSDELAQRLEAAQQNITDAPALDVSLSTDNLPDGVQGLSSAKGRGYQGETVAEAAFEGDVNVVTGGSGIKAEVVAVDETVWVKTSLAPQFLTIAPETLGAPDPAVLLGAKGDGLPSILVKTEDATDEGQSRDGRDVLTTIAGTLPGSVVKEYLPTADDAGNFDVEYRLTDDDVLQDATITGPFYPGARDVTYTVILTPNDDDTPIEPPARTGGA